MPVPNAPTVARVTMVFNRDSRIFNNTFHVENLVTVWTLASMTTLANEVIDWWNDTYRQCVPTQVTLVQVQVRKYDPADPLAVDQPVVPPLAGTRSSEPDAGNVTATLSWRTGFAGKRFRGRNYVPSLPEEDIGPDDLMNSPLVTVLAAAAADFLARFVTAGQNAVVFHLATESFTRIISAVIEHTVDSQRRRLPQRGR